MTEYIVRRTGKLLFPHLARDQRNRLLFTLLLILAASCSATGGLIMWMTAYRH